MISISRVRRACALGMVLFYVLSCLALAGMVAGVVWPQASGITVHEKGGFTVDASHAENGYIMAKAKSTTSKLKVRITKGETVCTYDLNGRGEYEVFPLQMGSGSYKCTLYKNISGNKYSTEGSVSFKVKLTSDEAPYLLPNQYVNYTQESPAVRLSMQICEGLNSDAEKFTAIRDYIKKNFLYDFVKAATAPAGTLPNIDACIETRMGICQDLTALAACMLRVQGIPTRFVIGYADRSYHAWNAALVDGEYRMLDVTAELKGISGDVTYTMERCY